MPYRGESPLTDRYNLNLGMHDIQTGIEDAANGRFEITGLAKQYMNYGETTRVVEWDEGQYDTGINSDGSHNNRGQRMGPNSSRTPRPAPRGIKNDEDRTLPPTDQASDIIKEKMGR